MLTQTKAEAFSAKTKAKTCDLCLFVCTCYVSFKLAIYLVIRLLSRKSVIKSVFKV